MKYIKGLLIIGLFLVTVRDVNAADLLVRVEEPESPSTYSSFKLNFVALDTDNRVVTVKCYKKGPGEATFSQFDSKTLAPGGDEDSCNVSQAVLGNDGMYSFYVEATANGDTSTSATVTVDHDDSKPGKPKYITKEKDGSCKYEIEFKTDDDGGQTTRAEVYRSENKSFSAGPSTRIKDVAVGSDTKITFDDNKPDCGKTYYYAIRAFDNAGNGSNIRVEVLEDYEEIIVYIEGETTETTEVIEAIPVEGAAISGEGIEGEVEVVLGEEDETEEGEVTGEEFEFGEDEEVLGAQDEKSSTIKTLLKLGLLGLVLVVIYLYARRKRKDDKPKGQSFPKPY